jgi:hypothetical protein
MGRECGDGNRRGARKDMHWSDATRANGALRARAGLGRRSGIAGNVRAVASVEINVKVRDKDKIKVNGGGQECPPHILPVQFPCATLHLPNALADYAFDIV